MRADGFDLERGRPDVASVVDEVLHLGLQKRRQQDLLHGRPLALVFIQDLADEFFEVVAVLVGNRVVVAFDDFVDESEQVVSQKRVLERAQFVEHTAERPHVRLERVWPVFSNLGTHVVRRADDRHCGFVCVFEHFRDSEVTQLDGAVACQKYVRSFDVSVDDFSAVDVFERNRNLYEPVQNFVFGESSLLLFLLDVVGKVSDFSVLHDDDEDAFFDIAGFVRHNVCML